MITQSLVITEAKVTFLFNQDINDKSALMHGQKQRNESCSQLDMVKIQSLFANAEDP